MDYNLNAKTSLEDRFCPVLEGLALIGISYAVVALDVIITSKAVTILESSQQYPPSYYLTLPVAASVLAGGAVHLFRQGAKSIMGYDLFSDD